MSRKLAAFILLIAVAASALATNGGLAAENASPVTARAGNYAIDPRHTQIIFEIRHLGLSTFYGRFGHITGTLEFDPAAPEQSKLSAAADMTNIQTHVEELDRELSKSVFHADKFPNATFTATKIVKTGENTGTVTGDLMLVGVTKPVTLNVTFNGGRNSPIPFNPYRIGFDATATIKRSDFGLNGMIWSGIVSDEVTLRIGCEMEKQ